MKPLAKIKPRCVPDKMLCPRHGERLTHGSAATPPGMRKPGDAPIVETLTLVTVYLACGCRRYFGVERAWINSRLRMCMQGGCINPQNEIVRRWPIAEYDTTWSGG